MRRRAALPLIVSGLTLMGVVALGRWVQDVPGWRGLPLALAWQVALMWWALLVLRITPLPLRGRWFHVRGWEAILYRRLGVYVFMRLLRAAGWERLRREARGFTGARASLRRLERQTREAESSHEALLLLNLVLPPLLGMTRDTAAWLLLSGVACHVYPALLQRALRARLQQLGVTGAVRSHHGNVTG